MNNNNCLADTSQATTCYSVGCNNQASKDILIPLNKRQGFVVRVCLKCVPKFVTQRSVRDDTRDDSDIDDDHDNDASSLESRWISPR
jgi:hypothetical protein